MARAGLGSDWQCVFANDFDLKKIESYRTNWPKGPAPKHDDIANLTIKDFPGRADLAWASFPCQDLSLAGNGLGLRGDRSGTFWSFWRLMLALKRAQRAPRLIAIENVCGTITSHKGKDFSAIANSFAEAGFLFGAVVIDAKKFVPQSRPRLFFIATSNLAVSEQLCSVGPDPQWHTASLQAAVERLPHATRESWIWWRLPTPIMRDISFYDVIEEDEPAGVDWHSAAETRHLMSLMSPVNRAKVAKARKSGVCQIGGVYRRTRPDGEGGKQQRAEIRFDEVAGCLRTPTGGSSRQAILVVEGKQPLKSRLLSPREAARLMGIDDTYILPEKYNDAYHLLGDGVVVDVVRFLSQNLLTPLLKGHRPKILLKAA